MRDEHRFREKIELSLENRHVRTIAFVAVLFLGGTFSLGVFVGKRLASRAAVPAPLDDLEALDAQAVQAPKRPAPPTAGRTETIRPGTGNGSPRSSTPETARARHSVASPVPLPPAQSGETPPAPPARAAPVRTIPAAPSVTSVVAPARTAQVTAPQTGVLPPPPPEVGKFTVQVGATQDKM